MAPEDSTTETGATGEDAAASDAAASVAVSPEGAAPSAAPARKRAPRRATKKASAPAAATTSAENGATSTDEPPARARRTAKATAQGTGGSPETTVEAQGQLEFSASDALSAPPPVKKAVRKRVTRKQVTPEPAQAPSAESAESVGSTDPAGEAPVAADTSAPTAEAGGTGLSVLFQAPASAPSAATTPRRRRAAAAPAGAPSAAAPETSDTAARPDATSPDAPGDEQSVGARPAAKAPARRSRTTRAQRALDAAADSAADVSDGAEGSAVPNASDPSGETETASRAGRTTRKTTRAGQPQKGGQSDAVQPDNADTSDRGGRADDVRAIEDVPATDVEAVADSEATGRDAGGSGSAGGEPGQDQAGTSGSDSGSDSADADTTTDQDDSSQAGHDSGEDDDEATPRRSRRRRGGKGRRGRGTTGGADSTTGDDTDANDDHDASGGGDGRTRREASVRGDASETVSAVDDETDGGAPSAAGRRGSPSQRSNGPAETESGSDVEGGDDESVSSRRRRRRRRPGGSSQESDESTGSSPRTRTPRDRSDEPTAVRGSTRLEAKKQRRREGREAGRRRTVITEAEFLARREAVDRVMVVRNKDDRTQMGVLEDGVLVEHYIDQATNVSMAGNIYLGRVQNVLPSMEAAFVDIGKGRNAVLYAGEVNWDAAGMEGNVPKRIENALSSGQSVLVQVTKDPIGHKGARLTSQISLPGRYLVYVPNSSMTGISRKLPDTERARLKKILRDVVPDSAGVIVRTAAEGATEEELRADVERLAATWEQIQAKAEASSSGKAGKSKGRKVGGGAGSSPTGTAPLLLHGEPDLTVRVIRDVFNEDFTSLVVSGEQAWEEIHPYISSVAPDLEARVSRWTGTDDLFTHHRVDEQLAKAMDRKVWLPSGGSLVIDRTEAMTVVDVNTGKFVGSGGNLEETVTKNNIEAAEEIVRQLRLRDIGGIIVVDFIDMVLESNRDLVVRRLLECLGRDRTKHQVAEVTSLGLVQMTRKRVGSGLIEVFGETCEPCNGRGFIIHSSPVDRGAGSSDSQGGSSSNNNTGRGNDATNGGGGSASGSGSGSGAAGGRTRRGRASSPAGGTGSQAGAAGSGASGTSTAVQPEPARSNGPTTAMIAAAAHAASLKTAAGHPVSQGSQAATSIVDEVAAEVAENTSSVGIVEQVQNQLDNPAGQVGATESGSGQAQDAPSPSTPEHEVAPDQAPAPESAGVSQPETQAASAASQSAPSVQSAPSAPSASSAPPAPRARRRRGRVVAPAGPPRESEPAQE